MNRKVEQRLILENAELERLWKDDPMLKREKPKKERRVQQRKNEEKPFVAQTFQSHVT